MSERALVISGGGAKGAFAVGVLDYLNTNHMLPDFDLFVGTSTGGLIAPFMAVGALDTLLDIYTSTTNSDFAVPRDFGEAVVHHDSLFDTTPLWNLINNRVTPDIANQILGGNKPVLLTTVSLQTSETVYFQAGNGAISLPQNSKLLKLTTRNELMRAMLATASQPLFTPLIKVMPDRDNDSQYCDGGVRAVLPLEVAIESGAKQIYAIALSPDSPPPVAKQFTGFIDVLERTFDLFCDAVGEYNIEMGKSLAVLRGVDLKLFQPLEVLNAFSLGFSPVEMAQMMEKGRLRASEVDPVI